MRLFFDDLEVIKHRLHRATAEQSGSIRKTGLTALRHAIRRSVGEDAIDDAAGQLMGRGAIELDPADPSLVTIDFDRF